MTYKKIISAFILPITLFILDIVLVMMNAYSRFDWLDMPMHFLGGVFTCYTAYSILTVYQEKTKTPEMNKKFATLFLIGIVAIVAIMWEFAEFGADLFFHLGLQQTVPDTLSDLFFGLSGATVGSYILT